MRQQYGKEEPIKQCLTLERAKQYLLGIYYVADSLGKKRLNRDGEYLLLPGMTSNKEYYTQKIKSD